MTTHPTAALGEHLVYLLKGGGAHLSFDTAIDALPPGAARGEAAGPPSHAVADLRAMQALVVDPSTDLFRPLPHGDGQTPLREALLVADHNAYHLGQLVVVRRLLGAREDEG